MSSPPARFAHSFANIQVYPSAQTRTVGAPGGAIQTVGPPRFSPGCACGGTCPTCRNPMGLSGGSHPITRAAAPDAATRAPEPATAEGSAAGPAAPGEPAANPGVTPARLAAHARLRSGPRYTPRGHLAPNLAGGFKNRSFVFDAVFDSDPANGVFPSCGEIHQDIKWDAAAATNAQAQWGLRVPHTGFPAGHPPNVWIEDRDDRNTRYGRRSGPMSDPGPGDQYTNSSGVQDMARGAIYHGSDNPSNIPAAFTGRWQFMVLAFDMCNRGTQVGNADFITIDW